jgi:hypothetical protein
MNQSFRHEVLFNLFCFVPSMGIIDAVLMKGINEFCFSLWVEVAESTGDTYG